MLRPLVEIVRRAFLLHAAGIHHDDAVGHRGGLDLVVRHQNRRYTELALDAPDLGTHRQSQRRVEIGQRLVEQQQMGPLDERASERHALLLAARELRRTPVEERVDSHQRSGFPRPRLRFRAIDLLEPQREHDVLEHAHARIQRVRLEHDADVAIARFDVVHPVLRRTRSRHRLGCRYPPASTAWSSCRSPTDRAPRRRRRPRWRGRCARPPLCRPNSCGRS